MKAVAGTGGYYQDSIFEQAVVWSGGSEEAVRTAAAANLGYELLSLKAPKLITSTGATFDYSRAALLQMPARASVGLQAELKYGSVYRYADAVSDRFLPLSLYADVNENILNPLELGIMPESQMKKP
ncbi:MAG: hypothetical protein NDI91_07075 [Sulfuritalea sp.]|nr:hypothetical protein [Sulfuritalea sp.]